MGTINKLTKLVLSFLLVITCINFSIVQAEDGSDENYSEPTAVETISEEPASEPEQEVIPEEPVAEEPVVEEAAPVEEEKQEEVTPEVTEEAKVEEENNIPEIEAEPATQEETVEPEVQQEAPVEPEVQKVETVEEVKVTVVVSYVDENDHPLTDPITGSYPIEYRLDENVDAFKSFDGYAFEKVIVNDDAKNTISKDDVQKNGFRITKDMTSLKLVYQKMNLESNESKEVIPEVTEEAVEEAEPESNTNETELSAFDQTAFAGKVGVHASAAEGVLPKGARLIVEQVNRKAILNAVENTVSDNNKEMDSAVALDISIVDKDGNKIQPNGIVNITFVNTGVSGDEVKIYHVEDDASAVTEIANNTDSFDASHFSIYVITGENKPPLTTFNFVANGNIVSTQTVKTGDTLITPTAPDMDGKVFVGWYDGETKFEDFNTALTISETTTREITAKYEDALYIYFYNPAGTQIMRTEKVSDHKGHDFTNISYEVDATHKIVGWAAKANGTENTADSIAVPAHQTSVNVYAIIKEGYWISFDSDGGSIVDSQFVLNDDKLTLNKSTTPTKPGYEFAGWYNGLSKVENGATVTSPMTLKAHWNAAQVNYTVIHWWENADDDGYSFHESETKTGLTGTEVNAAAKSYNGFTAQPVTKKTIKGDGSTIVSVYYKRNVYEVKFYSYSTGGFFRPGKPSKEYEDLRITAKYGQDISKKWPTYSGSSTWSTTDDDYNGPFQVNIATMPLGGAKFYGPKTGRGSETAYYYVEVLPGEPSEVTKDGIRYKLDHKDTSPGTGYSVSKEDQYPLTGYTFNEKVSTRTGKSYDDAKFYYTRNSYEIKFINYGKEDKSVDKKYQESISNENYTPTRPRSLADYYAFDGWYDNELCEGEKYVFNGKTMPAQNVTLYAKWTAKKISLTYNLNNPEGTADKGTKKVAAGTIASTVLPSASAIEDYSFAGWYVADENGHMTPVAFNANDAILRDTNVIGKWLYNGKLTVKYVADGVEAPKDNNVYAGGAKAKVANGVTKDGQKFLGWQLDGKVYQPGQNFEVNKDLADDKNVITMTAVFGDSETSAILTYHHGNGNGEDQSDAILNNGEVTLKNTSDLIYTAPGEDYYFAGWATSMEDAQKGNATYAAGDKVRVNADSSNDLYATWVKKTVIEVTANSKKLPYNGEEQKVDGFKDVTAGYEVTGLKAEAKGTNFGTYDTVITGTAKVTKGDVDVTDKVIVNKINGTLTISKREVTLKSETASKPYDGTPLTRPDVKMTGSFVNGEVSDVRATGSVTNVSEGEVTNTITYKTSDKFNTDNYTIVVKEGKLSITPVTDNVLVEIKGKTKTVTYNGNTHEVEGYKYTNISNALYPEEAIHFEGTAKASRKEEGTSYMGLNATQFSNTSANFTNVTFRVTDGWLKVDPKSIDPEDEKTGIQVTKPSDTMYNGEEQKNKPTVEDTKTGATLVENVDYTLSYTAAVNAGTVEVTITGIENYTGTAKTSYEITKRNVTLTSASASKPYDKTPLTNKNVTIAGFGFVKEEGAIYNVTGSQTEKGTSKNTFTYELKSNTKASNYTIKVVYGDLTVTAEDGEVVVIITGRKDTFEYDGTEKSVKGYDVSITEGSTYTESDFTFSGNDEVKGTEAGTYDMGLKPEDFTNNNENYGNVTFRVTDGQLIITPKSINPEDEKSGIEATDPADSIYNGEAHVNPLIVTDTKTGKDLVENKNYTLTYVGDVKNVGTVEVKVKGIGNYTGEFTKTYKITPREYTVTTDSAEKPYDGTALTAGGKIEGIVKGETYSFTITGTQTDVGSSDNTYDLKWTGSAKEGNYEHGEDSIGTLTVKKQSIDPGTDPEKPNPDYTGAKVNSPKDSVYDGKEHKWTPTVSDADDKALTEGTDYTVSYNTADFTNVHTIAVTIEGIGNYTGTVVRTYAITPAEVTVTANNANKVYGENDPELKATVTGTLNNDTVDYTVTRVPGEDVGKYAIHVTGDEDQGNYHVTYTAGEFEITKSGELILTAELTGESATKVYDGNPLTGGATANVKEGTTITYSTDGGATWTTDVPSITNVGTLNITARAENPNYEPAETTYSLTVTHATAIVTAENKTKVYGTADPELTATVSGTLGNDTVAYTLAREAGENAGKYKITVTGEENQGNYKVTYTPGTFEITPKPIIPDGPETPEKPKPEVKKSVDTSDDNNTVFYGNAFFMAMITLAGIIVLRKKSS